MELASFEDLFSYGKSNKVFTIQISDDKVAKFEMTTLTPLEEAEANYEAKTLSKGDEELYLSNLVISTLSRSIKKINDVDLDKILQIEEKDPNVKKRKTLEKFSSKLILELFNKYKELKETE